MLDYFTFSVFPESAANRSSLNAKARFAIPQNAYSLLYPSVPLTLWLAQALNIEIQNYNKQNGFNIVPYLNKELCV